MLVIASTYSDHLDLCLYFYCRFLLSYSVITSLNLLLLLLELLHLIPVIEVFTASVVGTKFRCQSNYHLVLVLQSYHHGIYSPVSLETTTFTTITTRVDTTSCHWGKCFTINQISRYNKCTKTGAYKEAE
jgi:hypothetical protein